MFVWNITWTFTSILSPNKLSIWISVTVLRDCSSTLHHSRMDFSTKFHMGHYALMWGVLEWNNCCYQNFYYLCRINSLNYRRMLFLSEKKVDLYAIVFSNMIYEICSFLNSELLNSCPQNVSRNCYPNMARLYNNRL